MINVGILLQDKGIDGLDLTDIKEGNPGIGGTEYLIVLLCSYFNEYRDTINLTVYHFNNNKLPIDNQVIVSSEEEAFANASDISDCIFIMKNLQDNAIYSLISKYDMKYIIWCHNFMTYDEIKFFSKTERIKRVIAVGRQMYDYYIDHRIVNKLDYIFNMFVADNKVERKSEYAPCVTYIGSLIYQKSFHVLADVWKKILEEVPDARLNVIGTGKLYDRNAKLGKLGIAEESYEEMFLKNLTDENGRLLESVTFHGLLGKEKNKVFENTAVGVVNPLASTETFCLCATEMEAAGIPIVSRRKNGLVDTVIDGETGILYKDVEELAGCVVKLLKNELLNKEMGERAKEFSRTAFTPDKIMPEWIRIIEEVNDSSKAKYRKPDGNYDNNGKRVRMLIHALHSIPLFSIIPSVHDIQKK